MPEINLLVVLVAALAHYFLGALWYSPLLFGNAWMAAIGKTAEQIKQEGGTAKAYIGSFISTLVMAFVLAHFIWYASTALNSPMTFLSGASGGFWAWLGFILTSKVTNSLFQGTPMRLIVINAGYYLVGLLLMGGIIGGWS